MAARVFHEHAVEYDSWFTDSLEYAIELDALRSLRLNTPGPKLEVGVGPGRFARELGVAFGLDPAEAPLHIARQRGIKCCRGSGEHLPIKNSSIGTVYLLFTLCFALDPKKIIAECSRVLIGGGYLVLGMVPAESKWGQYLAAKKESGHIFYEHAAFYTVKTVSQWLVAAGMEIMACRSSLYQAPANVEYFEKPREILDEQAGFIVIAARKNDA